MENARVYRLEREILTKVEKRQQLLAERREMGQTESRPLAGDADFF